MSKYTASARSVGADISSGVAILTDAVARSWEGQSLFEGIAFANTRRVCPTDARKPTFSPRPKQALQAVPQVACDCRSALAQPLPSASSAAIQVTRQQVE